MITSFDDLKERIVALIPEESRDSEELMTWLEDYTDTTEISGDVKSAIAENNKEWRKKFVDRFMEKRKTGDEIVEDETDDIKEDGEGKEEPVEIFKKRVKEER